MSGNTANDIDAIILQNQYHLDLWSQASRYDMTLNEDRAFIEQIIEATENLLYLWQ